MYAPPVVEAGNDPTNPVDTDGNGIPDYLEQPAPVLPPVVPPTGPLDSDANGVPDVLEVNAAVPETPAAALPAEGSIHTGRQVGVVS